MIPPLRIEKFSGIAPVISPRKLPDHMAQVAENCRLYSGEIDPIRQPLKVDDASKAAQGDIISIFKMVDADGQDIWLNWTTDVDAVRGPIAGDVTQRTYFTGDGEPRVTDLTLATAGPDYPDTAYVMGVFPPSTAPSVVHTGGSGAAISRSFVYTFVTEWGEESQPSPPTALTAGKVDGQWELTNLEVAPLNTLTVTGATWLTNEATLTVASTRGLRVGEMIVVTGIDPSGYNGTYKIKALTSTTVKYDLTPDAGAYVSGGTIDRIALHHISNMRKRIYWTETVAGETVYQLVDDIAATTTNQNIQGNAVVGEPIPSVDWDMPPTDMLGLVEMANGMMAAFRENEILFCEPYRPFAWPIKYRLATTREIVGLGVFETTLVACTKGVPYINTGTHPESMSEVKIDGQWPCASKRGIVSLQFGVVYPSNDGLILIGPTGSGVTSASVLSRKEFADFNPDSIFAARHEGKYFAWHLDADGAVKGFIFDKSGMTPELVMLNLTATAAWSDPENGDLYFVSAGEIKKWSAGDNGYLNFDWLSKVFVLGRPSNYAAAKVDADYAKLAEGASQEAAQAALDIAFNTTVFAESEVWPHQSKTKGCLNDSMLDEYRILGSRLRGGFASAEFNEPFLTFQFYVDGVLRRVKSLLDNKPFRLPSGHLGTDLEIRLSGNIPVRSVEVAGSMQALGRVP